MRLIEVLLTFPSSSPELKAMAQCVRRALFKVHSGVPALGGSKGGRRRVGCPNFAVYEGPGPSNVHVWALGLSCATRRLKNHQNFTIRPPKERKRHEKTLRERRRARMEAGEGKTALNFMRSGGGAPFGGRGFRRTGREAFRRRLSKVGSRPFSFYRPGLLRRPGGT